MLNGPFNPTLRKGNLPPYTAYPNSHLNWHLLIANPHQTQTALAALNFNAIIRTFPMIDTSFINASLGTKKSLD